MKEDTMKLKLIGLALSASALFGCNSTPTIDANLKSEVTANAPIATDTNLGVFVAKGGNEAMTQTYVAHVIAELKRKGYTNVFSATEIKEQKHDVDVAVLVNLDKKETFQKFYRNQQSEGFALQSTCPKLPGSERRSACGKNPVASTKTVTTKVPELVKMTGMYFASSWVDVESKEQVAYFLTTTFDESCDDKSTFNALISESMSRMNLSNKRSQEKEVRIHRSQNCGNK